jgi:hypothetical protein
METSKDGGLDGDGEFVPFFVSLVLNIQLNYRTLINFRIEPNSVELFCPDFSEFLDYFFVKSSVRFDRTESIN